MSWEAARRWALAFTRTDGRRRRIYGERSGNGWAYRVALACGPDVCGSVDEILCRCDGGTR